MKQWADIPNIRPYIEVQFYYERGERTEVKRNVIKQPDICNVV